MITDPFEESDDRWDPDEYQRPHYDRGPVPNKELADVDTSPVPLNDEGNTPPF